MTTPDVMPRTNTDAAYHRFLRYFYLARSSYDFIFAYAVYTVFFSLRGLSVMQIAVLTSWWSLTSLALEIPTGALADSWSRRKLLALAPCIKALCFLTWFFAGGNFYLYSLGFLFWSLGSSLVSGTEEALLYDTLVHYGKVDEYEKVLGRQRFFFHVALGVAGIGGSAIAAWHIEWALLLSVVPLLCSALFSLLLEEAPKVESTREVAYFQHIRLALQEIRRNVDLRYLLIYLVGLSVLGDAEEFEQLYYQLTGLPLAAFGIVVLLGSLTGALVSWAAHRMKGNPLVFSLMPVIAACCLAVVWRWPGIPAIGLLQLAYVAIIPAQVLVESRMQHTITSVSRATVTSAAALLIGLGTIGMPLFFGLVSKLWHLPAIYLASAIVLVVVAIWTYGVRLGQCP